MTPPARCCCAPGPRRWPTPATSTRPGSTWPWPRCPSTSCGSSTASTTCAPRSRRGDAQFGVLLRPATVAQIEATAHGGERMPPKTTFFHPKPKTGLVFRARLSPRPGSVPWRWTPPPPSTSCAPTTGPSWPPPGPTARPRCRRSPSASTTRAGSVVSTRETAYKVRHLRRPALRRHLRVHRRLLRRVGAGRGPGRDRVAARGHGAAGRLLPANQRRAPRLGRLPGRHGARPAGHPAHDRRARRPDRLRAEAGGSALPAGRRPRSRAPHPAATSRRWSRSCRSRTWR